MIFYDLTPNKDPYIRLIPTIRRSLLSSLTRDIQFDSKESQGSSRRSQERFKGPQGRYMGCFMGSQGVSEGLNGVDRFRGSLEHLRIITGGCVAHFTRVQSVLEGSRRSLGRFVRSQEHSGECQRVSRALRGSQRHCRGGLRGYQEIAVTQGFSK